MHKIIRSFSIFSLALIFTAVAANAQSVTKVEADIPFAFSVGSTSLAPGRYDISVTTSTGGTATVNISQKDGNGKWTLLGLANAEHTNGRAELVFDRYDDERVLRRIVFNDNGVSINARSDRKLRYAMSTGSSPDTVAVGGN